MTVFDSFPNVLAVYAAFDWAVLIIYSSSCNDFAFADIAQSENKITAAFFMVTS